jgi:hypothetical protein
MIRNFYLLLTLSIASILSLIYGVFEKLVFSYKLYLGLTAIALCYILYFKTQRYFKYFFGLILLFSVFNVISFNPFLISFGIGFLKFQLIPLFFSIFFFYFNRGKILDLIQGINKISDEEILHESQTKFEKFKRNFENLSDVEIEDRLSYNLTHEAKKALLEIKKERKI